MRARPTGAQKRASDPSRSAWVTAHAGTGKTRVLSDRVLRLLLEGVNPESILCLTFTRAAAAEMVERVEKRLAGWAVAGSDADLAAEIEECTGVAPDGERLRRARRLFARILELPAGLPVMTLHAFATSLLRRFPVEAGVAPHFRTLDEPGQAEFLRRVRGDFHAWLGKEKGRGTLAEALERLAVWIHPEEFGDRLDRLLAQRNRLLRARTRHRDTEGLLAALRDALGVPEDPGEPPEIVAEAMEAADCDREALRRAAEALDRGTPADRARAKAIRAWLAGDHADPVAAFHAYRRVFLTATDEGRKSLVTGKVRDRDAVRAALVREQARLLRVMDRIRALLAWRRSEALLRIGFALIDRYEEEKRRHAVLDYEDLIERARALLEAGTEWVQYKLDARIEHLLLDEAQDTSPAQWAIIERLTEEFFAGAGAHERPRTLFVVGDEKQSIYRFQGADLEHFRAVRARILGRAEGCGAAFAEVELERSFRSTRVVLELVDAVFARPEARRGVVEEGRVLKHVCERAAVPGLVELWPLAEAGEKQDAEEEWPLPDRPREGGDAERAVARAIAATIGRWLEGGELLESAGRPVRAGDILVLLSQRGGIQERIVRALKAHGIPVAGIDRLALGADLAVQDLLALGRVVLLPEDDLSLACLLKSPLLGIDETTLFELAHGRGEESLHERLRRRAEAEGSGGPCSKAWRRLSEWMRRADFLPPFEFYAWILGADGGRRRLLERLGTEAVEPIEAFLARARAYEEGHAASLQGFLHWFETGQGVLRRDPEQPGDAVRVLTVHGAKGLEAPIVFLADAGPHGGRHDDPLVWLRGEGECGLPFWRGSRKERPPLLEEAVRAEREAEEAERRRLLYVALTRARDRLYITGWKLRTSGQESWHRWIEAAMRGMEGVESRPCDLGPAFRGPVLRLRRGGEAAERQEGKAPAAPLPVPEWLFAPAPPEPPPARRRAPSASLEEPPARPPRAPAEAGMFERGLLIHRLLELLPRLAGAERHAAGLRLAGHLAPAMAAGERRRIVEEALRVLALPGLAPLFGPGSRAEQAIAGWLDGRPVSGRIDRFAVTAEEVLLADFKSHLDPPPPDRLPEPYLVQLRAYGRLLGALYPGRRLRAFLVWTVLPRVDEVEAELLTSG